MALTPNLVLAQVPESQAAVRNLTEYEGHYQYRDGLTLFMVTSGKQLVAIIHDSKYLLRAAGTDTFLNPAGDSIPFVRDPTGRIVAFKESGEESRDSRRTSPKLHVCFLKPERTVQMGCLWSTDISHHRAFQMVFGSAKPDPQRFRPRWRSNL